VETSDPTDILYQLVNSQVTPESSLDQICQQVQAAGVAAGIPEDVVGRRTATGARRASGSATWAFVCSAVPSSKVAGGGIR